MSPKLDEKTQTVDLPKQGETSNYVKFGHPFDRESKAKDDISGTIYVPKAQADGVQFIRVTLMKAK